LIPKMTNTEVIAWFSNPDNQMRGIGLLITGGSRDERSAIANTILRQREEAGQSCLSLTPFEVVAAHHFGQTDRLRREGVVLINDLGELSQAEQVAIDVIKPVFDVAGTIEYILQQRYSAGRTTLVTTEHDLSQLETIFDERLAYRLRYIGFSIRPEGEDGELHADRS
jgi:hypothetical protein